MTLTEGSKVKSEPTERFGAHDFLQVVFTSKTSTTNNKGDIGHYRYKEPYLTLKEGSKVKSETRKRFRAHDFLEVVFTSKTSTTNNLKGDIGSFKFGHLRFSNSLP